MFVQKICTFNVVEIDYTGPREIMLSTWLTIFKQLNLTLPIIT